MHNEKKFIMDEVALLLLSPLIVGKVTEDYLLDFANAHPCTPVTSPYFGLRVLPDGRRLRGRVRLQGAGGARVRGLPVLRRRPMLL